LISRLTTGSPIDVAHGRTPGYIGSIACDLYLIRTGRLWSQDTTGSKQTQQQNTHT
jgi:hypothetical protein